MNAGNLEYTTASRCLISPDGCYCDGPVIYERHHNGHRAGFCTVWHWPSTWAAVVDDFGTLVPVRDTPEARK